MTALEIHTPIAPPFLADGHIVRDLGPSSAREILATLEEVSGR
jgi:hypothetical protein